MRDRKGRKMFMQNLPGFLSLKNQLILDKKRGSEDIAPFGFRKER
jgi:hypothetical protein